MAQGLQVKGPVARGSTLVQGDDLAPFAASLKKADDALVLGSVAGGLICVPLAMAPALAVVAATDDEANTHAWLTVGWDTDYVPTTATITFGTAWPTSVYDVAGKYINIPLAYVSSGVLGQVARNNLMLHRCFVPGGLILAPAAL